MPGALLLATALLASAGGCALSTFNKSHESRLAAEECEAEHGVDADECIALREQANRDFERFEDQARDSWGCGANAPDQNCPSPR